MGDDMLDIDLVQRSGFHHAGERDQREQRVVGDDDDDDVRTSMRLRSWARDVTRAQAQRGDVSRTCLRAKPAGHGRDKCAQPVVIAWSKLLREWPAVATWWGSSSVAMEF